MIYRRRRMYPNLRCLKIMFSLVIWRQKKSKMNDVKKVTSIYTGSLLCFCRLLCHMNFLVSNDKEWKKKIVRIINSSLLFMNLSSFYEPLFLPGLSKDRLPRFFQPRISKIFPKKTEINENITTLGYTVKTCISYIYTRGSYTIAYGDIRSCLFDLGMHDEKIIWYLKKKSASILSWLSHTNVLLAMSIFF